jgi:hypothetical protein
MSQWLSFLLYTFVFVLFLSIYRPSDRRLSAKLVPTFAYRGCHVVSVIDLYGHILSIVADSGQEVCFFILSIFRNINPLLRTPYLQKFRDSNDCEQQG